MTLKQSASVFIFAFFLSYNCIAEEPNDSMPLEFQIESAVSSLNDWQKQANANQVGEKTTPLNQTPEIKTKIAASSDLRLDTLLSSISKKVNVAKDLDVLVKSMDKVRAPSSNSKSSVGQK